ncbi:ABC transporter ATP-binding protein [Roseomonas marmotae]|uniref:ABC transporter ATP-binding protein n=1 Tax=Roseomonas marmotae TaxID=2768161 RepID=A0ABS3KE34_9PROT|nr:ABC transporter ATP-binding protein [Roseomonas marmotae]MBO1075242.1 ABC transporter ATP-binding protein [Roseomonas marmotae]QTI79654.1 ABC transporter ATP-binding protein [Roseomonas marmotae]
MSTPLLRVENLEKRFGGLCATDGLNLDVMPGELHALIGPNGAGKSTAIGQITGEIRPDGGRILFGGHDITRLSAARRVRRGLARSFQIVQLLDDESAEANAALAVQAAQGHSFRFWRDASRDASLRAPARALLRRAGLPDARHAIPAADLAAGERKQVELALALAASPRLLLLDEPMAGLGAAESRAMTETLRGLKGQTAILLVEHDMEAVFALADRISVLVYGKVIATGTAEAIRSDPEVRAAYLTEEEGV